MLRIHFIQRRFNLSGPAVKGALYDSSSIRNFFKPSLTRGSIPDETTILNFHHLLETHDIAADTLETVTLLLTDQGITVRKARSSMSQSSKRPAQNHAGGRNPETHQTRKGNQWHFSMKAHIGVDMTGIVHTVVGTAANVSDVTQAYALLHSAEGMIVGDASYRGVEKRAKNLEPDVL